MFGTAAEGRAACRDSQEERCQGGGGGLGVVAEEQPELAHPEYLVDEPGEARGEEERERERVLDGADGRARAGGRRHGSR